jgi:methylase of polypeptide subunit release factors
MTHLVRYEAARAALAEARRVDEVKDIRDKAEAVRAYARMAKDVQLEMDAVELRLRAERRMGILIAEMKERGELHLGGRPKTGAEPEPVSRTTLRDLDIDKKTSSRAQRRASLAEEAFEALVEQTRQRIAAREGAIISGARAIMSARHEPENSLDYFPTPPWATRALMEIVLPHLGVASFGSAWEPACGEGHMAEVLREYFGEVFASDVHDYGYGGVVDFLADAVVLRDYLGERAGASGASSSYDWIVTNPPFAEKAAQFVLRALDLAAIGVAMFFRLQWIPTGERYEKIFRDRPPTLVAFFCERVNLCKGRWDPDGSTATDYIWLVWRRGDTPRPPLWIPPGQRRLLERPGDRERFTAHPVARAERAAPVTAAGAPIAHDPETGEVVEPDNLDIPPFLKRQPVEAMP